MVLSDWHPISSNHITPESNIKVARIKEVITVVTGSELCYLLCYVHELIAKRVIVTIGYSS